MKLSLTHVAKINKYAVRSVSRPEVGGPSIRAQRFNKNRCVSDKKQYNNMDQKRRISNIISQALKNAGVRNGSAKRRLQFDDNTEIASECSVKNKKYSSTTEIDINDTELVISSLSPEPETSMPVLCKSIDTTDNIKDILSTLDLPGPEPANCSLSQKVTTSLSNLSKSIDTPNFKDKTYKKYIINPDTLILPLPQEAGSSLIDDTPVTTGVNVIINELDPAYTESLTSHLVQEPGPSRQNEPNKSLKRPHRTLKLKNKSYLDYVSDTEDFSTFYGDTDDSDNWSEQEEITDDEKEKSETKNNNGKKNNKKRQNGHDLHEDHGDTVGEKGMKKIKRNERKQRSDLKNSGKQYIDKRGNVVLEKKVLPNPCQGKKCGNNCGSLSEERRQQIFTHFWQLNQERRKDWLVSLVQKTDIKRKRTNTEKRKFTFKYFINDGEGKRQVCLQFLAASINISEKTVYGIVSNAKWGCAKEDLRGKCVPPNKTTDTTIETVMTFLKSLPAVPSHYCRQDSTKTYLPQEFKNTTNLYNIYKTKYTEEGVDVISLRLFRKLFNERFNIGFHVPKKDKCLKCLKFENVTDPKLKQEKEEHEKEKEASYSRFRAHKLIYKEDPTTLCASFDLEKVLNTPYGQSMLLYYSRKLAVYNFCIYENGTREAYSYYWDESNGKRGANEIASLLHKYVLSVDVRSTIKTLLLYCDCCPGPNRNRTILAMLHSTLQECIHLETIQLIFLLTGHTYMPVDSVHAVIENKFKNTFVYAPSQWYTIFATARQNPSPYKVERVMFKDFTKWDTLGDNYFKGNLAGKISKIRIITLKKKKTVTIKYSMNQTATSQEIDVLSKTKAPLLQCYRSKLPISKQKFDDLNKLCNDKVIPNMFHNEYVNIPRATNTKDCLAESDIEDPDFEFN